ncbi:MAG: bifunctional diguanylate cyclase/phosphodiesterase [Paracoccaceae bacterium]|nr:bifunctional diguanylate cyclase/phosphodiesterase [Paracoccaceae bacterium]
MGDAARPRRSDLVGGATRALGHPGAAPGIALGLMAAYGLGGAPALVATGLAVTLAALLLALPRVRRRGGGRVDGETGLPDRASALSRLEALEADGAISGRRAAALAIGLERVDDLTRRLGAAAMSALLVEAAARLSRTVRGNDLVVRLDGAAFGVVLCQLRRADLEMLIQIGARVQRELSEPFEVGGQRVYVTVSVGFCLPNRAPDRTGQGLLLGAERALAEAQAETGGAIRAYSREIKERDRRRADIAEAAATALASGDIRPWFQPQISTDTGAVSGAEALARWELADGTAVPPGEFLRVLEAEGLIERLGETVLTHTLAALADWDDAGATVPGVSVNLGTSELRNPRYVDRVRWELDRFDIAPDRLTLEVRDISSSEGPEDMVLRNLGQLSRLGCHIDLDNFGVASLPLSDIRRIPIRRIKIDRSFVARVDLDVAQQQMVTAILQLADQMGIDTMAEGVETIGEHAMLAQLGCRHVQGFALARPMAPEGFLGWALEREKRPDPPAIPGVDTGPPRPAADGKTA